VLWQELAPQGLLCALLHGHLAHVHPAHVMDRKGMFEVGCAADLLVQAMQDRHGEVSVLLTAHAYSGWVLVLHALDLGHAPSEVCVCALLNAFHTCSQHATARLRLP
jgi:hypothetical protein